MSEGNVILAEILFYSPNFFRDKSGLFYFLREALKQRKYDLVFEMAKESLLSQRLSYGTELAEGAEKSDRIPRGCTKTQRRLIKIRAGLIVFSIYLSLKLPEKHKADGKFAGEKIPDQTLIRLVPNVS